MTKVVYGLRDPRTGEIRYVGKSSQPHKRLRQHVSGARCGTTRKDNWLRQLGTQPELVILERDPTDLDAAERTWIAVMKAAGCRLTNLTDGGEGVVNPRDETREKIRKAHQGVPKSDQHKKRISIALHRHWGTTPPPADEIAALHDEGWTLQHIALRYGCVASTVRKILRSQSINTQPHSTKAQAVV